MGVHIPEAEKVSTAVMDAFAKSLQNSHTFLSPL